MIMFKSLIYFDLRSSLAIAFRPRKIRFQRQDWPAWGWNKTTLHLRPRVLHFLYKSLRDVGKHCYENF